jgi:hypothetical protein
MSRKFAFQLAGAEAGLLFQVTHSQAAAGDFDSGHAMLEEKIDLDLSPGVGAEHLLEKADPVLSGCLDQLLPGFTRRRPPEVREVHHGIGEFSGIQCEKSRKATRAESDPQKIDRTVSGDDDRPSHRSDYGRPPAANSHEVEQQIHAPIRKNAVERPPWGRGGNRA